MPRPAFPKGRHLLLSLGGSASQDAAPRGADASVEPLEAAEREAPLAASAAALPRALAVDLSAPASPSEACAHPDGSALPVRCSSSLEGREHAQTRASDAARLGEAVLLGGLDRWWRLGPDGAGFCDSCGAALIERIRESYGEHILPFDALQPLRPSDGAPPVRERPLGGIREALRLSEAVEAAKRANLRARDESRRSRGMEVPVLGRVDALSAAALFMARHFDGLIFPVPSMDAAGSLLPFLAARAALRNRPAIAVAPATSTAAQVALLAALATACDVDLALEPGASREAELALATHREYLAQMRERFRPAAPLADLVILASPRAEAWTYGRHLAAASAAASTIARLHLQIDVTLSLPSSHDRAPLVLASVGALREDEAAAARKHVTDGGDLLLIGRCAVADDEGRALDKLFPEAKAGLNRIGEGRVWAVTPDEDPAAGPALEAQVARAARELLGRGRASVTLTGRGSVLVRAYLDPERKLDVHLVNLDVRPEGPVPAQGITLHLAGQIAGGGRSGYWFAPDRDKGTDGERIALNAAGFGVSTVLPRVSGSALLTVPR